MPTYPDTVLVDAFPHDTKLSTAQLLAKLDLTKINFPLVVSQSRRDRRLKLSNCFAQPCNKPAAIVLVIFD